jgi:hypothetical protein
MERDDGGVCRTSCLSVVGRPDGFAVEEVVGMADATGRVGEITTVAEGLTQGQAEERHAREVAARLSSGFAAAR